MGTDLIESPKELVELTTRCEEELGRSNELDEKFGQLYITTKYIMAIHSNIKSSIFVSSKCGLLTYID